MRPFHLIILPFLFLFSSVVTASEQYPYYASVAVTETFVRSGPGIEFYPTSQLWLGDKVEVYYETEEWCAIRPPIGSFSWISARYVDLGTNNIGRVIADGLASRVGSENTKLCDTVQVKLKKGEKVFVLDRLETPENIASPLWFKIVPPSGEFRWVSRDALMLPALMQTAQRISPKRSIVQVTYEHGESDVESGNVDKSEPIVPPPTRPVKLPTPRLTNIPANEAVTPQKTMVNLPSLSDKLASNQSKQFQTINLPKEPDPFQNAFEELKEETRIALTRPTEEWVFDVLIHRGSELYEVAPTNSDLEKVYHLVETLQRTKAVRREIAMRRQFRSGYLPTSPTLAALYSSNAIPNVPTGSASNSGAPAPMNPATSLSVSPSQSASKIAATVKTSTSAPTPLANGKTTEFDLAGKLGAFQPLPKGHPPYALVDEQEQIICLVSPAAGVDLKPYLGKMVKINGILGFFEKPGQPNRRHILACEVEAQ
ncbi:MAG: hypothetical protein LBF88_05220 [Planctomycetaceae bacterium]|jgi:hypothetical protein|nr:hypothetical protein [Planctomycetaceae bacterium]